MAFVPLLMVVVPFLAAAVLWAIPRRDWGIWANLTAAALGLALACCLPWVATAPGTWLVAGPASIHLVILGSIIGLAAAWSSRFAAPAGRLRLYHALFQSTLGCVNLALLADNVMLTGVALEAAGLAVVLAAMIPGSVEADGAAWRILLLVGSALVLAAVGTLLLYLAALPALGPGWDALRWSALPAAAAKCDGTVLSLAFVLLLLGYGGLAALVPLQGWLIEAQAAPVILTGVLGGSVPSAALLMILRLRAVLDGNPQAVSPGGLMMAIGGAALLVSAIGLWRAQAERRWLALSSVGQNGLVAFAFGLGGATATMAGFIHLTAHSLAKAAAFQGGTGRVARAAIAGMPPFGVFGSLVLILQQSATHGVWLALLIGAGVAASSWAVLVRPLEAHAGGAASIGAWACLAGALGAGLLMPSPVLAWFQAMAAAAQ